MSRPSRLRREHPGFGGPSLVRGTAVQGALNGELGGKPGLAMTPTRRVVAGLGLLAGVYALVVRPRLLRWGASDEEVRQPYPGADLVPGGRRGGTMAATIDAPPSRVRPWLVQMGCDRAGWYSWDRLDNGGVPSAERIHPEWQTLSVGDRLASTPSGRAWFVVAALEPERFLGLRASLDWRGRPFDPAGLDRPSMSTPCGASS